MIANIYGYYILSNLFIMLASAPLMYVGMKLLVKTKGKRTFFGVVFGEILDDGLIPLVITMTADFFPLAWFVFMVITIVVMYGFILGRTRGWNLLWIIMMFWFIVEFPYFVQEVRWLFDIEGWVPLTLFFVVPIIYYIRWGRRIYAKKVAEERN